MTPQGQSFDDLFELAVALQAKGDHAAAVPIYEQLAHERATVNLVHNLGSGLLALNRFADAKSWLERVRAQRPDNAQGQFLSSLALRETGDLAGAEDALRHALRLRPDFALAEVALAELLLSQARWEEGWRRFEARTRAFPRSTLGPEGEISEWRGESLEGKSLLVTAEQGLGDQIFFARFVQDLPRLGAREVTLVCEPLLQRLFQSLAGPTDVVAAPAGGSLALEPHDYWVRCGSLPLRLGVGEGGLRGEPYLFAKTRRTGGRIGVMARGSPLNFNDAQRSLPADLEARLLGLPGAMSLDPAATRARDFAETAEIVAGLDLVISVCTSVAHLAGAMGVPVWVLVPGNRTDWRWQRNRSDSPWYPTARLFRQSPAGWAPVIDAMLDAMLDERGPAPRGGR